MTKQKQIEEMVKTVVDREKNYVIGETECKKCNLNKCDLHCNIHSEISYDCETLYNAGYRKSEEVRKETAKEILLSLRRFLIERFDYFGMLAKRNEEVNSDNRIFDLGEQDMANCTLDRVNELLEKYGVEVEK